MRTCRRHGQSSLWSNLTLWGSHPAGRVPKGPQGGDSSQDRAKNCCISVPVFAFVLQYFFCQFLWPPPPYFMYDLWTSSTVQTWNIQTSWSQRPVSLSLSADPSYHFLSAESLTTVEFPSKSSAFFFAFSLPRPLNYIVVFFLILPPWEWSTVPKLRELQPRGERGTRTELWLSQNLALTRCRSANQHRVSQRTHQ